MLPDIFADFLPDVKAVIRIYQTVPAHPDCVNIWTFRGIINLSDEPGILADFLADFLRGQGRTYKLDGTTGIG